jgi:hypothetical protein
MLRRAAWVRPLAPAQHARGREQFFGMAARGLQPQHADEGRLVGVLILAGRLAQRGRICVTSRMSSTTWKARPTASRKSIERPSGRASLARRRRPSARWPAAARRSCAGACRAAGFSQGWPTLARSIAWPPAMPTAWPAERASSGHSAACSAGSTPSRLGRQHLERQCLHGVAGQQRLGFAELHVHRGLAAAHHVVIHAGHVVVHQRIGVDQLHGAGRTQGRLAVATDGLAGGHHQQRAQALAAAQHGIAHGFAQHLRSWRAARSWPVRQ